MTVLASGLAMAAYVCPQWAAAPAQETAIKEMPCAGMDEEKPVHCAEFQSGAQLALEHLAAAPSLSPVFASMVMPALAPAIPLILALAPSDIPLDSGADPPYLRTRRLRI